MNEGNFTVCTSICVLLLEKLHGLILINVVCFVNNSAVLNKPKLVAVFKIAKHALSRWLDPSLL